MKFFKGQLLKLSSDFSQGKQYICYIVLNFNKRYYHYEVYNLETGTIQIEYSSWLENWFELALKKDN